jgi:Flp pilus assembly pilin Flp
LYAKARVWRAEVRDRALEDRGATAVEYALMLALIAMVVVGAVALLGQSTTSLFEGVEFP